MTCKHRWEPSNFGVKYVAPNLHMYRCIRCEGMIWAILKEKQCD